ncbi:SprT family protein [Apilactobacillus apisilvae]|uniref:SprT family protein n=1 Tax=Apilactobacillus apisilvae TaxID=2923364 RepID=A0ABY4PHS3_9LACO|nr:SprT family protein [Apilactobacillus apisilvae]UQS85026.1 SprT family protein [Apilactobacillus apisilvae]
MTNKELQLLVEKISITSFARRFLHKVYFNARLKTTGGRYHMDSHNIDINPKMLSEHSYKTLVGVIKHELCHYHLHLAGYSGKHNTNDFKNMLKAVGGLKYAPSPDKTNQIKYICTKCGQIYLRKRRIDTRRYVCGKCHGKLIKQGMI